VRSMVELASLLVTDYDRCQRLQPAHRLVDASHPHLPASNDLLTRSADVFIVHCHSEIRPFSTLAILTEFK